MNKKQELQIDYLPFFNKTWNSKIMILCNFFLKFVWWFKPLEGKFNLIYTNASIKSHSCGGLLGYHRGNAIIAFYEKFGDSNVLVAQSQAFCFFFKPCVWRGFYDASVEIDSYVLLKLVSMLVFSKWPLYNFIAQI